MEVIPFNFPYICGDELSYIKDAMLRGHLSGKGYYTIACQKYFEDKFQFNRVFLTHSCTGALEMAALLSEIAPEDEVIIPSFTFVSVANAFALRGAKIIMADNYADHPNIDPDEVEKLISPRTKVLVIMHYSGVACDMEKIMALVKKYNLFLVEDCAHAIGATYKGIQLGSFGHLSVFSFHETKNIHCGEGGLLVVNDNSLVKRAEIIWEKGTDRSAFYRGEVDKYSWVDIGSSFQMSELNAAFLWAQFQNLDQILKKRIQLWNNYFNELRSIKGNNIFVINDEDPNIHKAHIFYLLFKSEKERERMRISLINERIQAVFHYTSLHLSKMSMNHIPCNNAELISSTILRLPLFINISDVQQRKIISIIKNNITATA